MPTSFASASMSVSVSRRLQMSRVDPQHPDRAEIEAFIATVYRERYDAELRSFLPQLIAFRDDSGEVQAAVGLRYARDGRLFVEPYLDASAETVVARLQRVPESRERLVEVGSFASRTAGDAREVIVRLTGLLHGEGLRWVLFAATKQLRNTFDRLHLATVPMAPADSARLQPCQTHWGRYYDAKPVVLMGDIASGYAYLQRCADEASEADSSERSGLLSTVLCGSIAAGV
jgi:hypothetical protein